jgi:16S rRNA (cytidine1402-2'-O)-methyltransferase
MEAGKLILVPTPIGNLEDITLRALNTLKSVDYILAEDTRTSGHLLKHFEIHTPTSSYHKFNEHQTTPRWISLLQEGKNIALISDAGTPGISDPGFLLTRACRKANIRVECLPGASALIPALAVSGLPTDRFCFEGFLPTKKGRQTRLIKLSVESRTMVFYESPHRLIKSLEEFASYFGNHRNCCVCREISKLHEESYTGTIEEAITHFKQKSVKGEIVIVVEGLTKENQQREED